MAPFPGILGLFAVTGKALRPLTAAKQGLQSGLQCVAVSFHELVHSQVRSQAYVFHCRMVPSVPLDWIGLDVFHHEG